MATQLQAQPGVVSVAQELPFELLQEIFEIYLFSDYLLTRRNPNTNIFLLCKICSYWRHAALQMPRIWSSTTFRLYTIRRLSPPYTLYIHPESTMFIAWWEMHLHPAPPSIYLHRPPTTRSKDIRIDTLDDAYTSFFSSPFFRSARSLSLDLINQELDIICAEGTVFPNLRDLRIENNPDSRIPRSRVLSFPLAPQLARLHLTHADNFNDRILPIFPWRQITHLYMPRTIPQDSCHHLLERTPSLLVAAFMLPTWSIPVHALELEHAGTERVPVRRLRHLVLASSRDLATLSFGRLHFPALTALRVASAAFQIRDIAQLHALLAATPALVELHLDNGLSFADEVYIPFHALDGPGAERLSALVPRLRWLVVDYIEPLRQNVGGNIIRFLQSAWLCAGWRQPERDAAGAGMRRQLQFVVENVSHMESHPVPHEIVAEVRTFLASSWPQDAPFEVSIRDADSLGVERHIFDVFDERLPSKGWNSAVDFYDKL